MRALIVAFYVVVGIFLISTLVYIAQSDAAEQQKFKKERVVNQHLIR